MVNTLIQPRRFFQKNLLKSLKPALSYKNKSEKLQDFLIYAETQNDWAKISFLEVLIVSVSFSRR